MKFTQEYIVNHLKNSGFVFQGSEIYGGLANTWDYGFLGSLVKNNIKKLWIQKFIKEEESFLIDSAIFMNPKVWEASGHLDNFQDPLIDCKGCKGRFREDHLIEKSKKPINNTPCPTCGKTDWTDVRQFNLMFKTKQGVTDDTAADVYLRPETAQGIFVNFKNISRTTRKKLPFGIGQIGKAFRNEITPGNFIFRTREFEQMELEYFVFPEEANKTFKYFLEKIETFLIEDIGLNKENIKQYNHPKEKLSHYSAGTTDFEYNFPFGWQELWGIANRTDFDLNTHMKKSGTDLTYLDDTKNEKITPFVIEPSVGVDRLFYAVMCDSMNVEKLEKDEERIVLKIKPTLAPYQLAILPLTNKQKDEAKALYDKLIRKFPNINLTYDYTGSIGKRYRRQDAIGTYLCLTVDFDTSTTNKITIRNRDTMKQDTIEIKELDKYINNILNNDNK